MTRTIAESTDFPTCLALRYTVFVDEQGVPVEEERDAHDAEAVHLLATIGGEPAGTARIVFHGNMGKIGRVCVLRQHRGTGLGAALVQACLERIEATPGISRAMLGAQTHALGFYERLGFVAEGPVYLDAGIPHRDMALDLPRPRETAERA